MFGPRLLGCRALDFMDHLSEGPPRYEFRVLHRSALIVAFQCTFALRRENLMCMRLGEKLVIEDDRVWPRFRASRTKTQMPIRFGFSPFLKPYLGAWLHEHRPALLAGRDSAAVWINARHHPLGYGAAPFLFASMGELLIGRPITCHMFRHSVATAILTKDPRQMKLASGVLTHRSVHVTHRHYDHSSDEGSRRVWEKVRRDNVAGKGMAMK